MTGAGAPSKISFVEENMKQLFADAESKMKQAVEHFHAELKRIRTGRASVQMLDGVQVEYYGQQVPLKSVATLTVGDATMLVAQPFDQSQISAIERAILKSDLGLNPSNDGKVVRIPVPQPTEERRKELVRKAHEIAETARNGVRQARREVNDRLKKMGKDGELGADDEHRGHEDAQKLHDHYIDEVNKALEHKEKEILTV